jgi:hypothetical protein
VIFEIADAELVGDEGRDESGDQTPMENPHRQIPHQPLGLHGFRLFVEGGERLFEGGHGSGS